MIDIRRLLLLLVPLVVTLASGCAPLGAKPGQITVTSDPAGADVYVMGGKVGMTPLNLDHDAVFPVTFPSEKQVLYGAVELRKAGCKSSVQRVSTVALAKGLHVKLECGEAASGEMSSARHPQPNQRPLSAVEQGPRPVVKENAAIETRLRRVQELRDKGVITEQEAREIRQRILGEL